MKRYYFIGGFIFMATISLGQNFSDTFFRTDYLENSKKQTKLLRDNYRCQIYPLHTPAHPMSKMLLSQAQTMLDLIKEYPNSWITDYVSTEIEAINKGKRQKAYGVNAQLTDSQRNLLKMVDLNTSISIKVKYKQTNSATQKIEVKTLSFYIVVQPDEEANYPGGAVALQEYLIENVLDNISDTDLVHLKVGRVGFMVNNHGKIELVQLKESTGNSKVDQMLLNVIKNMPQWQAARNAAGLWVNQGFELVLGNTGC